MHGFQLHVRAPNLFFGYVTAKCGKTPTAALSIASVELMRSRQAPNATMEAHHRDE